MIIEAQDPQQEGLTFPVLQKKADHHES